MSRLAIAAALAVTSAGPVPAEALRIEVDRDGSFIAAMVDKRGLLTVFGAGHKHGVLAQQWSANVCMDKEQPRKSSAAVTIAANSLMIDTPEARKRAGLDENGPGEKDVREIQAKMLGPDILAAGQFKEISFRAIELASSRGSRWDWRGSITIRGVTKRLEFPVNVEATGGNRYRMAGSFAVKQSDFGITPISIAGVVKVKDEVEVRFELYGALTSNSCPDSR